MGQMMQRFQTSARHTVQRLFEPVDAASLAVFRIAVGALLLWEVTRFFRFGWIEQQFIEPQFHFTYFGFEWVRPLPAVGMYTLFVFLGVCAVGMLLGLYYRICTALFCAGFSYVFLIDQALYLNHFYLICLITFLLVFIPANCTWSLDAVRNRTLRCNVVPRWALSLLRVQIGIIYFYAGLAKLNNDWLRGEPMREWLAELAPGSILSTQAVAHFLSYGGVLFDLLVVPLLLWRRTRLFALAVAVAFHVGNHFLFQIGVFPWFMIAATLLFLEPGWPRRLLHFDLSARDALSQPARRRRRRTVGLIGVYLLLQSLIPLRHHLYPGNPSWTEEGHRFAWHMKLRSKQADALFFVHDGSASETFRFDAWAFLEPWQYDKMAGRPDMILQMAHFIASDFRTDSDKPISVHAEVVASLNSRPAQLLVNPNVDLASEPRSLRHASWINLLATDFDVSHRSGRSRTVVARQLTP